VPPRVTRIRVPPLDGWLAGPVAVVVAATVVVAVTTSVGSRLGGTASGEAGDEVGVGGCGVGEPTVSETVVGVAAESHPAIRIAVRLSAINGL
jgi:hypothetical protein